MSQLIIPDNQTVVLENTEYYDRVQLGAGASISAPEGKTISFVVDGVVTAFIGSFRKGPASPWISPLQI